MKAFSLKSHMATVPIPAYFILDTNSQFATRFTNAVKKINPATLVFTSLSTWELCGQLNIVKASLIFMEVGALGDSMPISVLAIRQVGYCQTVPIVAYCSSVEEKQALQWGADHFFIPPATDYKLYSTLKKIILVSNC